MALARLVDSMNDNVSNLNFGLHFARAMRQFLTVMSEIMIDQREIHDTNEHYAELYSNIAQMRQTLDRYICAIMQAEIQQLTE